MGSFLKSVAKHFCDQPILQILDPKTVLIYCPHPVYTYFQGNRSTRRCVAIYICKANVIFFDYLSNPVVFKFLLIFTTQARHSFNPLPNGPRSNLTQGFQRLTAQSIKGLKISKKLQLSNIILRLFYNIRNLHILPSLPSGGRLIGFSHKQGFQINIPTDLGCFPIIQILYFVMYHKQPK